MLQKPPTVQRTLVPAVMAAIAYVDPGNFGVNISAGREHGYTLIWVVGMASTMACLIQYLAAKLGSASGLSLPEACAASFGPRLRLALWCQAELVVVMTQLAEVVGAAIALNLLFGTPLLVGAALTCMFCYFVPKVRVRGRQGFAPIVIGLFCVIVAALTYQVALADVDPGGVLRGAAPSALSSSAAILAVGIIGATVMPHALHFHSAHSRPTAAVTSERTAQARRLRTTPGERRLLRRHAASVVFALAIAGGTNVSLMVFAVSLPQGGPDGIEGAFAMLQHHGQEVAAIVLGVALLCSGIASTLVGVDTGQVVTEGFVGKMPVSDDARRLLGLLLPLAILATGMAATHALVLSQVILSFCLPGTLIPLVMLTQRTSVMGSLVNRRGTSALAWACTAVIVSLDAWLLIDAAL